jgi:periphilin-1
VNSKEPGLEDKIQDSLRENLKEIGQRCIQELREFIDRLREEDEPDEAI